MTKVKFIFSIAKLVGIKCQISFNEINIVRVISAIEATLMIEWYCGGDGDYVVVTVMIILKFSRTGQS